LPLLSRKEKEKLVIKLANEGKTTREIAKIVHISLKDIGKIIRKVTGDDESPSEKEKEEEKKQKRFKALSPYARAFQMFRENKTMPEIVVELDLDANSVLDYHEDYLRLVKMNSLIGIYKNLKDDFPLFIHLYRRIKKEGLNKESITKLLDNQNKLIEFDKCIDIYNNRIQEQILQKASLEKEINTLRTMRDNFDGISPL
jgi:transposase